MMYTIEYSKVADKTLRKWKKSNPNLFKKATKILMDIYTDVVQQHVQIAKYL